MSYQFWPAPAKLNLFLNITGRREDGYHNLQTVFQFLDHGDRLRLEVREDGRIVRKTDHEGVKPEDDLVVKAAKALQACTGSQLGADIYLQKITPMGGGLGGGSSDAATVLVVLNQYWKTGLNEDELAQLGLQLGADVPVFVRGHAAFAQGVGEILEPVNPLEHWYLVAKPEVHISSAKIFSNSQLTRDASTIRICDLQIGTAKEAQVFDELGNVFEPIVAQHYPEVAQLLQHLNPDTHELRQGQLSRARLSGTGACVFAAFDSQESALQALNSLPEECSAFVAKGLNQSPLQAMLATVEE